MNPEVELNEINYNIVQLDGNDIVNGHWIINEPLSILLGLDQGDGRRPTSLSDCTLTEHTDEEKSNTRMIR